MNLFKALKETTFLQYSTLVYALLYALFISEVFTSVDLTSISSEEIGVFLLFTLFVIGLLLSWHKKIITGVILLVWNVGMWILELFFVEQGGGFGIIMGVPLIVMGVFFILQGIEKRKEATIRSDIKWKTALQILTITYTLLYAIVCIDDITGNLDINFTSTAGIILLSLIIIYSLGFILSRNKELIAGILFIIWYAGVFYIFWTDAIIGGSGPWIAAGVVVLLQGIFYINYWLRIKPKHKVHNR